MIADPKLLLVSLALVLVEVYIAATHPGASLPSIVWGWVKAHPRATVVLSIVLAALWARLYK